jgi:hypothetical protein
VQAADLLAERSDVLLRLSLGCVDILLLLRDLAAPSCDVRVSVGRAAEDSEAVADEGGDEQGGAGQAAAAARVADGGDRVSGQAVFVDEDELHPSPCFRLRRYRWGSRV